MNDIYSDNSYMSIIRNTSGVVAHLINSIVPIGGYYDTSPGVIHLTNFDMDTYPFSSFVTLATSIDSDDDGTFSSTHPTISIGNYADILSNSITIILHRNESFFNYIKKMSYTIVEEGYDSVTKEIFVGDQQVVNIFSEHGSAIHSLNIEILSTGIANSPLIIETIINGECNSIEPDNIKRLKLTSKTDITLSTLPMRTLNMTLIGEKSLYANYNVVRICFYYIGDNDIQYWGEPLYLYRSKQKNSNVSNDNDTEITGVDLLQFLQLPLSTKNYFHEGSVNLTTSPISDIMNQIALNHKREFKITYDNLFTDLEKSWFYHALYDIAETSALQLFSFAATKYVYTSGTHVSFDEYSEFLNNPNTHLSRYEMFTLPDETFEQQLNKLSLSTKVQNVTNENVKEIIIYKKSIYITPNSIVLVKFGDGYIVKETDIKIEDSSGIEVTSYFSPFSIYSNYISIHGSDDIGGDLYVTIQGHKVDYINYTDVYNDSDITSGEDLTITNDIFSTFVSDNGLWRKTSAPLYDPMSTFLKKIYTPYNKFIKKYTLKTRGRFDLDIMDVLPVELMPSKLQNCVITKHELTFNGAFNSNFEMYLYDDMILEILYPSDNLYPRDNLFPKEV